uniref:Uncharacterized protein n=1 Tax=Macaca fascicularis TaxID=9541 RepID=A0A7N9C7H9_MACFA
MESSCWDKVPPGERSPQQGQHWRVRDHGARGCGPHQPKATACPRPGLWTTPAHGHCMPQTNTRRVQTNNIFVYVLCSVWFPSEKMTKVPIRSYKTSIHTGSPVCTLLDYVLKE